MKIGFEAKRVFNNFTGLGNYGRSLLTNLATFYPDNDYLLYTPKIKSSTEFLTFQQKPFQPIVSKARVKSYWRSFGMTQELEADDLVLYHGLSHELPFNIKNSSLQSVVTIHDLIFKRYPNTYPWIDRKIYDFKFKQSCLQADKIIAISESTKKDIIHFYGIDEDKIVVAYQSCNSIYYEPLIEGSQAVLEKYQLPKDYFLFVGSVETRKNIQVVIKAYRHLPKDTKIPLIIIGRPSQGKEQLLSLIASEGLKKQVFWVENLTNNEHLKAIYHAAKALIYPSLYEGFGLPVIEALLSKTPVITSNTSSLPEAAGPDSLWINPNSPEELAEAMEQVLGEGLRKKMIERGYQYALDNFGRKTTTDRMMKIYQSIIL